jgi:hypothetical protein
MTIIHASSDGETRLTTIDSTPEDRATASAQLRANRATAENVISVFYARTGRPAPTFLWFDDPVASVLACHALLSLRLRPDSDLSDSWLARVVPVSFKQPVGGQIRSDLWSALDSHLERSVSDLRVVERKYVIRFWTTFWMQVERSLDSAIGAPRAPAYCATRWDGEVLPILRHRVRGFWGGVVEGGPRRYGGHGPAASRLDVLQRACGWWYPYESVVICADAPCRIQVDAHDRLHNESGPAVELSRRDKVYAWHGTHVPSEWIGRRDALSPSIALAWPDSEQRRAAGEMIGWANVLERVPKRVLDADPDPQAGTLLEFPLPSPTSARFLHVRCATGRDVVLRVPPDMTTARQANAWTYGLQSDEYQLEART